MKTHQPSVLFLSELKTSSSTKILNIFRSLGFPQIEFIPAVGSSGGIALGWKDHVDIKIIVANSNIVNALVISDPPIPLGNLRLSMAQL